MAKKLFYKIGEACKILDIKPFVLRYWETEFPFLKPDKSRSGQRIYSESDLEVIQRINELLNVEGYTIAGARKKLQAEIDGTAEGVEPAAAQAVTKKEKKSGAATRPLPAADTSAVPVLDTEARERVERFRTGVEAALHQARAILDLLGASPT